MTIIFVKRREDRRRPSAKKRLARAAVERQGGGRDVFTCGEKAHFPQEVHAAVVTGIDVIFLYSQNIYCIAWLQVLM